MTKFYSQLKKSLSGLIILAVFPISGAVFEPFSFLAPRIHRPLPTKLEAKLEDFGRNEILVKFKDPSPGVLEEFQSKYAPLAVKSHFLEVQALRFAGDSDLLTKLEALRANPKVQFAEPNYRARAFFLPDDPYLPHQWSFGKNALNLEQVWELATGKGAVVAVVDTGVAYENFRNFKQAPDLQETRFVPGYNFVANTSHANDDQGHGTHVAGTIAQSTDNGIGAAGIAYNSAIMPVKVLDRDGSGTYSDIADGIVFAAQKGAKIINLSLGGPYPSETLRQALAYAKNKGVLIVAASGNDGGSTVSYPAAYDDYVLAIGATRFDKNVTAYSNRGASLDLVAPGGDTKVDQDGNGYGDGILQQTFSAGKPSAFGYYFFQGTSMATPHAAAAAALLVEKGITDPEKIRQILQSTALDLGPPGWDQTSGWGFLNPLQALLSLQEAPIAATTTTPPATPEEEPAGEVEPSPTPPASEPKSLHIGSLNLELLGSFLKVRAKAKVLIVDQDNKPLKDAEVKGVFGGLAAQNVSGKTNAKGLVELSSPSIWRTTGQFTFTVNSVTLAGYEYRPENNQSSSGSVDIGSRKSF